MHVHFFSSFSKNTKYTGVLKNCNLSCFFNIYFYKHFCVVKQILTNLVEAGSRHVSTTVREPVLQSPDMTV